ncbi:hypothetical protein J5X84_40400 [Streptosporangiaceae bacterium NEAU-GS5]|nr:hypothetical protein [Streptosporangiaceae bacterium NEAU-GS5]
MAITTTTSHVPLIDLQEARVHHLYAERLLTTPPLTHLLVQYTETGAAVRGALDHIPALCDEADRLRALLTRVRLDHANLIAAVRATLSADRDGEPDPLSYLRDELPEHSHAAHADLDITPWDGGEGQ